MDHIEKLQWLFAESLPFFNALGDPVRQQLVLLMMDGRRRSVAELAGETELTRPTISHHLKVLKDAHIIRSHKVGRKIYYSSHMAGHFQRVNELIDTVVMIESQE